jgi:hypothetical protein
MIEWLVSIETANGVTRDEDTLIRFRESFETVLGETGVAASMNTEHGWLGSTFSIAAPTAEKATEEGFVVFRKAVELTGLAPCDPARVEVEQIQADEAAPA